MFFAVPHRGMDVTDMIAAIQHHNSSETRLRQISDAESYWRQELDNFVDIIEDFKVASFYETELTKRLIMASFFLTTMECI
jgi:protein SERAC1